MALAGLTSRPSPGAVASRYEAPAAQPGPGTATVPGPGHPAGRDEQCPGWLPGPAGGRCGAATAAGGPVAAVRRHGDLPPSARPGRSGLMV